jgi:peroxiredoxin
LTGDPAPLFSLPDLEGAFYHLECDRGRIVVINFWSAECPWAERADRAILPYLEIWGPAVSWISVAANANEPPGILHATAQERRLPCVLYDPEGKVVDLYGGLTTPHVFVIDATGIVRYQGAFDDMTFRKRQPSRSYLIEAVQALLSGTLPEVPYAPPYGCTIVRFNA